MFNRLFLDHPRAVDERYGEHFVMASGFGFAMIFAGLACLVHALVPGLFATAGSDAVDRLHHRMIVKRRNRPHQPGGAPLPDAGE